MPVDKELALVNEELGQVIDILKANYAQDNLQRIIERSSAKITEALKRGLEQITVNVHSPAIPDIKIPPVVVPQTNVTVTVPPITIPPIPKAEVTFSQIVIPKPEIVIHTPELKPIIHIPSVTKDKEKTKQEVTRPPLSKIEIIKDRTGEVKEVKGYYQDGSTQSITIRESII